MKSQSSPRRHGGTEKEPEGLNVSGISSERLKDLSIKFLWDSEPGRAYVTQSGLNSIAFNDHMVGRLKEARDQAERDAIKNLQRYKFSNFGYHAARWVTLNRIIGDKKPNPFKHLVDCARAK
jgi:hypothetical protein